MTHEQTHEDTTVATILLLWRVLEVDEPQRSFENLAHLARRKIGFGVIGTA